MTKDLDRNICAIQYNVLNLPSVIQFRNGNQIAHVYDAAGNRVETMYYTRKSTAPIMTSTILCPEDSLNKYDVIKKGFNENVIYKYIYNTSWITEYIKNPEGYMWDLSMGEYYPCYYIKDHVGNNCQTWIYPYPNYKECIQRMQYYPSGLPWNVGYIPNQQPYKYNGKEFVEQFGLDEYDSKARWYYPAIARTTTMDPLCEKYYDTSPYAWCGNNTVRNVDLNGMDWYQNNESHYYTWFAGNKEHEGYTYYGPAGSLLGEFEPIIDNLLVNIYNVESLYSNGFSLDIVSNNKGAIIGSPKWNQDFLYEFVFNEGPEFSVFFGDHPYTQQMMNDTKVNDVQNKVRKTLSSQTDSRKWTLWSVFNPYNWKMARQFIGSYSYYGEPSANGQYINNVIYDTKNVRSLFLHIPPTTWNKRRSTYTNGFGNTYQFYIWQSLK